MDKQEWKTVRLVQALDKPLVAKSGEGNRLTSVMEAFDGVSRTLSDAGRALFQPIFSWHYMGAAEYEWGAIPEALGALAKDQAQLRATTVVIPGSIVHRTVRFEPRASRASKTNKAKPKVELPPVPDTPIYVLGRESHLDNIEATLLDLARRKVDTKRSSRFSERLDPATDNDLNTIGWLELDNGWFAFVEREPWEKVCSIFDVDTTQVTK